VANPVASRMLKVAVLNCIFIEEYWTVGAAVGVDIEYYGHLPFLYTYPT
jgi:hypothetical protein